MGKKAGNLSENQAVQRQHRGLRTETEPFIDEDYVIPEKGTDLYNAQNTLEREYGIETHVVKRTAWTRESPATTHYEKIYIVEDIDDDNLSTLVHHESAHAIKEYFMDYKQKNTAICIFKGIAIGIISLSIKLLTALTTWAIHTTSRPLGDFENWAIYIISLI